ncbi:hypothetical protein LXA43DRAFT_989531 [Ganoderma leucocontextum]|nr:hypothetical protein LXA43DRAFT_989531 [Ganoderma leucocontextum]
MPRRTQNTATPKKLTQGKLDVFLSSSPTHPSSPARPQTRSRSKRKAKAKASYEDAAGPSHILVDEDEDGSQSSDAGAIRFEAPVVVISSSEDEGDLPPRPTFSSKGKKRTKRAHSAESVSAPPSAGEEEQELYVRKGKRAGKKSAAAVLDSDEEEELRPLKKRKLVKGKRPPTPEEHDLMDEVDEARIIDSRLRTRDKRSAFQKNLEKLRRKKRGETIQSESEGEDEEEEEAAPFAGARPDNGAEDSDGEEDAEEEEEEDTFIVEDGSAQVVDLPAEFSMGTYQDLLHHFKIVCQMYVHILVHDPEDREEAAVKLRENQYFSVPLKIARRKLYGMRDSLVAGSTWKPRFRKALDTYPNFESQHLEFTALGCDACNLGGRKSTIQGRLSGEPYDPQNYEAIADEPSSDEDEESGEVKKEFDLGRFCAKRTRTYHQFTHWEYHLFHALRDEVESLKAGQEERSFVRVAYAKGKQPPADLSDADAIMDWLDERQVINIQWQEIKTMMENARHLEVKGGRGDDMDSD